MKWAISPTNDLQEHDTYNSMCKCEPTVNILENGDIMIIHNSFDGREGLEMANEILKK